MQICHDTESCFMGNFPTLAELKKEYNSKMPVAWLIPQLQNLSWYCGVKDKLNGKQLEECAYVIASQYSYLKVSELMLFFSRFKAGRYGKFYGNVDPLVITTSLRDFIDERNTTIDRYDNEQRRKQLEEEMKNGVSREEAMNTEEYKRGYEETS